MPALQQSQSAIYKETSNLPRPQIDRFLHDKRDSAGYALARMLKVGGKAIGGKVKENQDKVDAYEAGVNVAHSQLNLEKFNSNQAKNGIDLLTGDFDPDAYKGKQGQVAGTEFVGGLRDKYQEDKVFDTADPEAFNGWLKSNIEKQVAAAKAKGPSYYAAFMRELGNGAELMSKQFAGHSSKVMERSSRTSAKERLKMARAADKYTTKAGELGGWLKTFLGPESGGNWNAWFGNAGNTEDLSQLTLGEIRKRQARPGNDAAGLIQIIPATLDGMIKKYGYSKDTKFTPQVQTEMALLLMREKGMDKWIKGTMSDGVFADRVASIWAGFKTSRGKGVYDGDGVNKGTQSHGVTMQRLGELRHLLEQNPNLKKWISQKDAKAGSGVAILDTTKSRAETSRVLKDEKGTGLDNKQLRDTYAETLVEGIADGSVDADEVEDEIKGAKLNKEQAKKVREAADVAKNVKDAADTKKYTKNMASLDRAIRFNDAASLEEIKISQPAAYKVLMRLKAGNASIDAEEQASNTQDFFSTATYGAKDFTEKALKAVLTNAITEETYTSAMEQHEAQSAANKILSVPAISQGVAMIASQLPASAKKLFNDQLALVLSDLSNQTEGKRPPVTMVMAAVQELAQRFTIMSQADAQTRMSRPEYNQ